MDNTEMLLLYFVIVLQAMYFISECARKYMTKTAIDTMQENIALTKENARLRETIKDDSLDTLNEKLAKFEHAGASNEP